VRRAITDQTQALVNENPGWRTPAVQATLGYGSWALPMNTYSHATRVMQRDAPERMDALLHTKKGLTGSPPRGNYRIY
jgi:hypothetical protein